MECCGKSTCGPLLHYETERVLPFRPVVECEKPGRSWGFSKWTERRPRFGTAHLLTRCQCARRADGFTWKSSVAKLFGPRFPILSNLYFRQKRCGRLIMARVEEERHGSEETSEPEAVNLGQPIIIKKSSVLASSDLWLQLAIFVFTAGFVDAGFSGDWSRIGVLSKQIEEELQMAAVGIVPLAVTLIWSISQRTKRQ